MRKREQFASLNEAHPLNRALFGVVRQLERKGLSRQKTVDVVLKAASERCLQNGIRNGWTRAQVREYRAGMRKVFAS